MIYFAFTSLTTVGFGDYYPRSSGERIVISIFIFFGVMVFSDNAGKFLNMLTDYNKLHVEYEDSDGLSKFIETLRRFNMEEPVSKDLKKDLWLYFNYRWANHKYHVFESEEGNNIAI